MRGPGPSEVCPGVVIAPAPGDTIPADVKGIPFMAPGFEPQQWKLEGDAGAAVPATIRMAANDPSYHVLVPSQPLTSGKSYKLVHPRGCAQMLKAGPAASWPDTPGTLKITVARERKPAQPGDCGGFPARDAVVARVQLEPSPALQPHLPVTRLVMEIDGQASSGLPPAGGTHYGTLAAGAQGAIVVGAGCNGDSDVGFTTPGRHEIAVWVLISGERLSTPLRATIDLSCADADAGADATEAGMSDTGPPDQVTVTPDAGADGASPAPDVSQPTTPPVGGRSGSGGGCAIAPTLAGGGAVPALALASLALAFALRRTRRVDR